MSSLFLKAIFAGLLVTILWTSAAYADEGNSAQFQGTGLSDYIQSYSKGTSVSYFKENTFKIIHDPMVCAVEDTANNGFKGNLAQDTQFATIDWSTNLNAESGKNHTWKIGFKTISYDNYVKYDPQCDILVRFFSKTTSDDPYFVGIGSGGVTYYDYNQHKAFIKILYDGLTESQLRGVVEHELGHAFGLGHYITSDSELERIASGVEDSPSIMVGVVPKTNYYSITPLDVQQIKSKYGNYGFEGKSLILQTDDLKQTGPQATSTELIDHDWSTVAIDNPNKFLPQMISDDASDGTSFIGTGSVLVKDLIAGGYLKIPDSIDKTNLSYELSLSLRYHLVSSWASGKMTDNEFINSLQDSINQGKLDLTEHYRAYES